MKHQAGHEQAGRGWRVYQHLAALNELSQINIVDVAI